MKTELKTSLSISLLIILTIFSIFQVYLLNKYSTSGDLQTNLLSQIKQIEDENNYLTQKIASYSAIASLSVKAQQVGFVPIKNTFALGRPLPVAYSIPNSL